MSEAVAQNPESVNMEKVGTPQKAKESDPLKGKESPKKPVEEKKGENTLREDLKKRLIGGGLNFPGLLPQQQAALSQQASSQEIPGLKSSAKRTRSQRKARKALTKSTKLVPIDDVRRVVMKQNKLLFIFEKPEVMRIAASKRLYLVFGEAIVQNIQDMDRSRVAEEIIEKAKAMQEKEKEKEKKKEVEDEMPGSESLQGEELPEQGDAEKAAVMEEDSDSDDEDDMEGINEKDVGVVVEQANVSKKQAIKALKRSNGDVVDAVIQLQGGE